MTSKLNMSTIAAGRVRAYRVSDADSLIASLTVASPRLEQDGQQRRMSFLPLPGDWKPVTDWRKNDVLYDAATIVCRLLTGGDAAYRIGGMYLEYKNLGDPDETVVPPAFDRSGGVAYFDALADLGDVDYLRVPLVAATPSSTDESLYPGGNLGTFFAMSQGTSGTHGLEFSDAVNSKIYGGALVAIVDQGDRTRDLVFSRFYLDAANQQVKLATSQIGLEWQIELQ